MAKGLRASLSPSTTNNSCIYSSKWIPISRTTLACEYECELLERTENKQSHAQTNTNKIIGNAIAFRLHATGWHCRDGWRARGRRSVRATNECVINKYFPDKYVECDTNFKWISNIGWMPPPFLHKCMRSLFVCVPFGLTLAKCQCLSVCRCVCAYLCMCHTCMCAEHFCAFFGIIWIVLHAQLVCTTCTIKIPYIFRLQIFRIGFSSNNRKRLSPRMIRMANGYK